jgi:hypothetical protein
MESPIKDRGTIDISKTVEKHTDVIGEILPVHALTGCNTMACCCGMGKGTALKELKAEVYSPALLGQVDAPIESVIRQATAFLSACYGCSSSKLMSETSFRLWASKTRSASSADPPKLCSLTPTNEAFAENVKRAQYQAIVWRSLETQDTTELDLELYGWVKDSTSNHYNRSPFEMEFNWLRIPLCDFFGVAARVTPLCSTGVWDVQYSVHVPVYAAVE